MPNNYLQHAEGCVQVPRKEWEEKNAELERLREENTALREEMRTVAKAWELERMMDNGLAPFSDENEEQVRSAYDSLAKYREEGK